MARPASINHCMASAPTPSKLPGLVLGFQTPPRNKLIGVCAFNCLAVSSTCSGVSTEHGPEMSKGEWVGCSIQFVIDCMLAFVICL